MPFIIAVCPLSQPCIGIFSRLDRGVLDVMLVYSLLTLWIFVSSYNRHIVGMEPDQTYGNVQVQMASLRVGLRVGLGLVWVSGNQFLSSIYSHVKCLNFFIQLHVSLNLYIPFLAIY